MALNVALCIFPTEAIANSCTFVFYSSDAAFSKVSMVLLEFFSSIASGHEGCLIENNISFLNRNTYLLKYISSEMANKICLS